MSGPPAEAEMKSKKDALDDAISSTKAAVAEGIVPGGGAWHCCAALPPSSRRKPNAHRDERTVCRY